MKATNRRVFIKSAAAGIAFAALPFHIRAAAAARRKYTLGVSIYAGWMPHYYANQFGILERHAKANGIEIELRPMDYGPSIEAYSTGQVDALVVTNMDVLTQPAASGIDSTAIIIGDYSNGNDALLVRKAKYPNIKALKNAPIHLVTSTVSEYLLARALEQNGMTLSDVKVAHMEDSAIEGAFSAKKIDAAVTWAPITLGIEQQPGVTRLYDSSSIPGEILDLCVVNTKVLKQTPALGTAITGAWYETLGLMGKRNNDDVLTEMGKLAKNSLAEYRAQLKTTAMFWKPVDAIQLATGADNKKKMDLVRRFLFAKGLLNKDAKSADHYGIEYPDGSVVGNPKNIALRFDTKFMAAVK